MHKHYGSIAWAVPEQHVLTAVVQQLALQALQVLLLLLQALHAQMSLL